MVQPVEILFPNLRLIMRIGIIGGGAAGFFSAIAAAQGGANDVVILEASSKFLEKVRISGGGRCNVTHACFDPAELCRNYPRGGKQLRQAFSRFMTGDTVSWFSERGVELKVEEDGRMFPITDDSSTIVDCLTQTASEFGVRLLPGSRVDGIEMSNDEFEVHTAAGATFTFDRLIVTTGGYPKLSSYTLFGPTGHTIIPPVPSLFTFNIPDNRLRELMGLSINPVVVRIVGHPEEVSGPLLFTHWGVSGPAVLKLSSLAARRLADLQYRFIISIDWLPSESIDETLAWMETCRSERGGMRVRNTAPQGVPRRLWDYLMQIAAVPVEGNWSDLRKEVLRNLSSVIHDQRLHVEGKTTFKEEFVTCGGISLDEIDFRTMESKLVKGLFFAGEVLDIDAVTGGFNFQAAWTTGFIAGTTAGSAD